MAMIPACPILSDSEAIGVGVAWCYCTLGDGIYTIVFKSVQHTHPVPVHGCSIVPQVVLNGDFNPVAPASLDPRSWVLTIEDFASIWTIDAVGIDILVSHIEVILYNEQSAFCVVQEEKSLRTFRTIPIGEY